MTIHLGSVSIYPCFLLYIVSKWDQTNDRFMRVIHLGRFDCTFIVHAGATCKIPVKTDTTYYFVENLESS